VRTMVDPETGEVYELLEEQTLGPQAPYDYADFRRACMTASREHRQALRTLDDAGRKAGRAEASYRRELSKGMLMAKAEHGATAAEHIAKGSEDVAAAYEEMLVAQAAERTAMEKVRLCRDDAQRLSAMGYWSREANADGWREAGGS
jgi:hypothetical protein